MGTAPGGIAYGNLNTVSTIALIGNTVSFTLTPAETPVFFFLCCRRYRGFVARGVLYCII